MTSFVGVSRVFEACLLSKYSYYVYIVIFVYPLHILSLSLPSRPFLFLRQVRNKRTQRSLPENGRQADSMTRSTSGGGMTWARAKVNR